MIKIELEVCEPNEEYFVNFLKENEITMTPTNKITRNGYGIFIFEGPELSIKALTLFYYAD